MNNGAVSGGAMTRDRVTEEEQGEVGMVKSVLNLLSLKYIWAN